MTAWEEVGRGWRRLQNEEIHILYASTNIKRVFKSRRMRWAGHVTSKGKMRNAFTFFIGKTEWKISLGRHSRTCEDTVRMDHREIRWKGVDWIHLAQDRDQWRAVVNIVINLRDL
jgi:hypothetical protein